MNMKALIAINEPRETGYRVAQVVADTDTFGVGPDLFWVDCPEDLEADAKWFAPSDTSFKEFPPIVREQSVQPISQGAQTL